MATAPPLLDLHLRSYGETRFSDRHDYAQLVLPLKGVAALEIEGRQGRLDHGALVAPGAWHSQCSLVGNRSLILDVGAGSVEQGPWLLERPFTATRDMASTVLRSRPQTSMTSSGRKASCSPLLR